jgi:DMSO/TMAO reductase YedYZ molybdopterin-dependent catalytic subunit
MRLRSVTKAGTGLAVGALLTAPLLGVFVLGSLARIPSVPFTVFEWLIRVLPGHFVTFGLDLTVRVLEGLGFNIKNTAKTAEQVLALTSLLVAGMVIGLLFFTLVKTRDPRHLRRYGLGTGAVVGVFSAVIILLQRPPGTGAGKVGVVLWVLGLFLLWGWGVSRLYVVAFPGDRRMFAASVAGGEGAAAPGPEVSTLSPKGHPPHIARAPAVEPQQPGAIERLAGEVSPPEARVISRRRFLIQLGGLVATIVVVGADVTQVLRAQAAPEPPQMVEAPIPFPNRYSPVQPVPGTRPEYTAVEDHYRIDINLTSPTVDPATWRLVIGGLVATPLSLTLDQIKTVYVSMDQFVTLSCISNPVGGTLIGTTLWTGVPLRDVLAQAGPATTARYAHIMSEDGFDEEIDVGMINSDPRIMLVYAWNGQPLTVPHGFPLRVYIPDLYGMKQPKWIKEITLAADSVPGYWVVRGWDEKAEMKTTSVIDTVVTDALIVRSGSTYVPVGGIAHAGAKGISQVEIQVDNGPWEAAELRAPLSGLTWVIWRYEWPFSEGQHLFKVRAYDGQGRLQETEQRSSQPSGATGIDEKRADIPPVKL